MTYYGGKELAAAFRTVRNNTIQIAEEIPRTNTTSAPRPTRAVSASCSCTSHWERAFSSTCMVTRSTISRS